ncbi:MAG TPA: phosphoribosylanthranilate isomerase [Caballeronia sp.]|nr:phosphoribosylanthranilate isomerase [Caballeronia sp.]
MRTRIKFCGCTSVRDAELAIDAGADAIGVIFAASSPRRASIEIAREIAAAVPPYIQLVGVFVDPERELVAEARSAGYVAQFSGSEPASLTESVAGRPYLKVYHVRPGDEPTPEAFEASARAYTHATWMFEPKVHGMDGGTGQTFRWDLARALAGGRRFVISGGLTPENVGDCVLSVRPYAVDVRSGIETNNAKDVEKMRAFVRAVREADAQA